MIHSMKKQTIEISIDEKATGHDIHEIHEKILRSIRLGVKEEENGLFLTDKLIIKYSYKLLEN